MNTTPVVSVVVPTYNRLEYLRAAVESVTTQTYRDWELIVVDDGSDVETRSYLKTLHDSRTTVVFHEHTGIPGAIRNLGIAQARGRFVAFLDSDDVWMPEKLHRQVELMEAAPERRWSYTGFRLIASDDTVMDHSLVSKIEPYAGSIVTELLTFQAKVSTPTIMAETTLLRELGGFDECLKYSEDYDLWLRMAMVSQVSVDPAQLCAVRRHGNHFSDNKVEFAAGLVTLFRKMERLMPTSRLRALSHQQWGNKLLQLAAQQARERDWRAMRSSLIEAVRGKVWQPKGWLNVFRAVAVRRR